MMNIKKNILKIPGVRQIQTELLGYKYRGEEKQKRDNYKPFFMSNGETLPYVSIIILNRNGKKNFETLLPSLDKCRFYDNYEIIIVDNASTDDSLEYIDDWKDKFKQKKEKANLSIQIRQDLHDLSYCGMENLASIADFEKDKQAKSTLLRDCMEYTPIRDAVAHTSRLTDVAKLRLNACFENIKARIKNLLKISSKP